MLKRKMSSLKREILIKGSGFIKSRVRGFMGLGTQDSFQVVLMWKISMFLARVVTFISLS